MIYAKTELGQQALRERSAAITPRQRCAFILLDGKHELDEVLKSTAGMGVGSQDIDHLLQLGLIRAVAPAVPAPDLVRVAPPVAAPSPLAIAVRPADQPPPASEAEALYLKAYPLAVKLTSELGLRGFRLNLAVERAGNYGELLAVLPKIREAVGPLKFQPLADLVSH